MSPATEQAQRSPADQVAARKPLRVLFNDPCKKTNPYHLLLARGLKSQDVEVVGSPPSTMIGRELRRAEAQAGRIDVVHVHWLHQPMIDVRLWRSVAKSAMFIAHLAMLRLSGRGIVWTAHNLKSHDGPHPRLDRLATRTVGRLCHRIIAHCDAARDDLFAHLGSAAAPSKIRVIPHGSYEDFYGSPDALPTRDAAREQLNRALDAGLTPEHRVLVFLGNIRPYKGVLDLIRAFRALPGENLRLIIAGRAWDADVDKTVRDAIGPDQSRIVYRPGFVETEQVPLYMCAADAAVFPYRDILTSGAVLLAVTFGLPCVAVRRGCIRETLDERGAFLYDAEDDEGLARTLREVATAPAITLRIMGEHNARLAAELAWAGTLAAKTRAVYQEAVAKAGK